MEVTDIPQVPGRGRGVLENIDIPPGGVPAADVQALASPTQRVVLDPPVADLVRARGSMLANRRLSQQKSQYVGPVA